MARQDRAAAVGAYRGLKEVKALSPSLQIELAKAGEGGDDDGGVVVLMSIPAQAAATSHEEQALAAAGVVAYERRRGGTVFITFLHVKKSQRRKGVGTALVRMVKEDAVRVAEEKGYSEARVEVCNPPCVGKLTARLYLKSSFIPPAEVERPGFRLFDGEEEHVGTPEVFRMSWSSSPFSA